MTARLSLICHAATSATGRAAFPADDEPLIESGAEAARLAAPALPSATHILCSPMRRAQDTATALGLTAESDPALRDLGHGRWTGQTLAEIATADPEGLAAWTKDPAATPHGGESVAALIARTTTWMARCTSGRTLAITHAANLRAALLVTLDAPAQSFWRIDVPPLTRLDLTHDGRRWALRGLRGFDSSEAV
jgi:broad specificity phosphatase PhoE